MNSDSVGTAGTIAPSQDRSRRTHERILRAVESLLRVRDFEQIRMQDVAARARVSVGTIYGRFESKQAMIPALYRRYDERLGALLEDGFDDDWDRLSLAGLVDRLVQLTLDHYEAERGLLRLIAMPGSVRPPAGRMQPNATRLMERIYDALEGHAGAMRHRKPREAIAFGLYAMYSTARDWVLHPAAPQLTPLPRDRGTVRRLLARQLLAFLRS